MDITTRCNLKCLICPRSARDSKAAHEFDIERTLFNKIAEEIFPRTSELFLSCGSEPLMARNFFSVLEVVRKAKIPFVAFTTNGLLLNETIMRKLISSGIKEIYVSFDGAVPDTFAKIRSGASIHKVIENLRLFNHIKRLLSAATPRIELHTTLMRSNIDEIAGIIEIAHDLEVPRVTARHLCPFPQLGIDDESLHEHKDLHNVSIRLAHKRAKELGVDFESPPLFNESSLSTHSAEPKKLICLLPWTATSIGPDGVVRPCTYWHESNWFAGEHFGNLHESNFWDIWYGQAYLRLREEIRNNKPGEICAQCRGRQFC